MMKEIFGEFLGTLLLLLLGNGVVAGVVLPKTKSHNSGWIVITMGWGDCCCHRCFCIWQPWPSPSESCPNYRSSSER